MKTRHSVAAIAIGLATMQATCFGDLVLNIDTANTKLWFTGSATGNLTEIQPDPSYLGETTWRLGPGNQGNQTIDLTSGPPAFTPTPVIAGANLDVLDDGFFNPDGLQLYLSFSSNSTLISATDPAELFDYGGLASQFVTYLATLNGQSLVNTDNSSGFADITINVVPEPATLSVLGLVVGVSSLVVMRRSRGRRLLPRS